MSLLITVVSYYHPESYSRLAGVNAVQIHTEIILAFHSHPTLKS